MNKKVKLLIITQTVDKNDQILGFFHRWTEEFAKHCEKVTVICLQKGEYDLPENVKVLSLGKDENVSKLTYVTRFYEYIYKERGNYDIVFVHMNPIYVVLGGFLWRLWGKKIGLWYTHKSVDMKLRIAEKFTNYIFTASKGSFRLPSKKVHILGHGIDVDSINNTEENQRQDEDKLIKIVHVGRITKSKNILMILEAMNVLNKKNILFKLTLVGSPITEEDKKYKKVLDEYIIKNKMENKIDFVGNIPHENVFDIYRKNDIAINLSDTGSVDKVVLEAMAVGIRVLSSNEAFKDILPKENQTTKSGADIAERILVLVKTTPEPSLCTYITTQHSLKKLIISILSLYE